MRRVREQAAGWIAEGKLKYRETVAQGIDNAPAAFIDMLQGRNIGKQIVRLDDDYKNWRHRMIMYTVKASKINALKLN